MPDRNTQQTSAPVIRIGLVQQRWHADPLRHAQALRRGVLTAADRGAHLIGLQELTLHRYFADAKDPARFALAEPLGDGPTSALCSRLARESGAFVVGSLFERADGRYFNTAVIFDPRGHLFGFTRKQHIPRGSGYHEDYYFAPGDSDYPVHDLGFIKIAVPTCYDQWFPEMARICALKGAELILYPTAIGSEPDFPGFDTQPRWQTVMIAHAIANGVFVAAVNRTGDEGPRPILRLVIRVRPDRSCHRSRAAQPAGRAGRRSGLRRHGLLAQPLPLARAAPAADLPSAD
ncbi:MAG: hypothetical protein KatS3mg052_2382 [Candidatus Roseilinea sp.]|nr:MAG: hypothetical protein KatS3mg052_2382 [Candidatus Roseilinea sp.]